MFKSDYISKEESFLRNPFPFKFKTPSSKNFLTEKLKDTQKLKLYRDQRYFNIDTFKKNVSEGGFPNLINSSVSPTKYGKRADTSHNGAKRMTLSSNKSTSLFNTIQSTNQDKIHRS